MSDPFLEVEALMEKMRHLQECRDEGAASQEEMASRFEIEKRESMLVFSSGKNSHYLVNKVYATYKKKPSFFTERMKAFKISVQIRFSS